MHVLFIIIIRFRFWGKLLREGPVVHQSCLPATFTHNELFCRSMAVPLNSGLCIWDDDDF